MGRRLTVYEELNTVVDNQTGEVITKARKQIVKKETPPEFLMLFTQGLNRITRADLTSAETKVMVELLAFCVNNSNMLYINPDVKKVIQKNTGLSMNSINKYVGTLVKKEILIKESNTYFLSPLIFGRGSWNDVKKLRQSFEIEYDFENFSAQEKIATKVLYDKEENLKDLKVVETEENISDNGKEIEQNIIVEDKENNDYELVTIPEKNNNNDMNLELELMKERNKAKELEVRNKELEIQDKQLELELIKMKNKNKQVTGNLFDSPVSAFDENF